MIIDLSRRSPFRRVYVATVEVDTKSGKKAPSYEARELGPKEKPPTPETAVFHLKPLGFRQSARVPIGQKATGDGRGRWEEYLEELALTNIVGWENVTDKAGPVAFNPEYMIDGTVDPDLALVLVWSLISSKNASAEASARKNGSSATSRARRSRSSDRASTPDRKTAARAASNAPKTN